MQLPESVFSASLLAPPSPDIIVSRRGKVAELRMWLAMAVVELVYFSLCCDYLFCVRGWEGLVLAFLFVGFLFEFGGDFILGLGLVWVRFLKDFIMNLRRRRRKKKEKKEEEKVNCRLEYLEEFREGRRKNLEVYIMEQLSR
jgi:hypothetical protein